MLNLLASGAAIYSFHAQQAHMEANKGECRQKKTGQRIKPSGKANVGTVY